MHDHKKIIIFDLDNTLAPSKGPVGQEMLTLLCRLLEKFSIAIITGGKLEQIQEQLISDLTCVDAFQKLYLLPTSGATFYRWNTGSWVKEYAYNLEPEEKDTIMQALRKVRDEMGDAYFNNVPLEEQAEDRDTQVTFSALGQNAKIPDKKAWDPDRSKRSFIKGKLDALIPEFEVRIGGSTSVDISKPGIDKGFGIAKFFEATGFDVDTTLFIGDAVFPGGNDNPVKQMGIDTIAVTNPKDTQRVIMNILG